MKTLFAFLLSFAFTTLFATDLYVKEFGGGGAYSTISDAIIAANPGDRILILPKAGNAPYIESLSITKALQLLTATNGSRFTLQGSVTIGTNIPASSVVVIDGISISSGNITGGNSTNAVTVYLVNSALSAGNISFGTRFYVTVANNSITYTGTSYALAIANGKIVGNTISSNQYGISVTTDAVATTDTLPVVGNKVGLSTDFATNLCLVMNWANNTQFFNISNNYFYQTFTGNNGAGGITYNLVNIGSYKSGTNSSQFNTLMNNAVYGYSTYTATNIYYTGISASLDNRCNVFNNLIIFAYNATTRRAFNMNGSPQFSYNIASGVNTSSFNIGSTTNDGTNSSTTIAYTVSSNGCPTTNINSGHPDPIFTDLDLTRNDVGPCGGSFNITSNFLTGSGGTAKVHWLNAPRRVLQGGTINIIAEGHDR